MATVTNLVCDHCAIDDTASGVGKGNVKRIECTVGAFKTNGERDDLNHVADLCCDCEKELRDAVTRWMLPKKESPRG